MVIIGKIDVILQYIRSVVKGQVYCKWWFYPVGCCMSLCVERYVINFNAGNPPVCILQAVYNGKEEKSIAAVRAD